MRYEHTEAGIFIERLNRFVARVVLNGKEEHVHVKNTGRGTEVLLPGAEVTLAEGSNPARKTRYDLISVRKPGVGWVNIDSQAPNQVAAEWLRTLPDMTLLKPETSFGESRIDFYLERGERRVWMEVKGCTLEIDGIGYFPDAPTERGIKHLKELTRAVSEGYEACITFVIQVPGVREVRPHIAVHPEFGSALAEAHRAGVKVLFLPCLVTPDSITYDPCHLPEF